MMNPFLPWRYRLRNWVRERPHVVHFLVEAALLITIFFGGWWAGWLTCWVQMS